MGPASPAPRTGMHSSLRDAPPCGPAPPQPTPHTHIPTSSAFLFVSMLAICLKTRLSKSTTARKTRLRRDNWKLSERNEAQTSEARSS